MAEDPSELIGTLAEAYVESRCLHVVAALGVADEVDDEPRPIGDIAGAVGADPGALFRIMRHLAATGVFAMVDGTFVHNEASRLLRSDDPSDLLGLVRMMGMPVIWDSFAELEHSARTGRPATEARHPEGFFGYLADHPAESRPYDEGMTAMTVRRLPRILPGYDFSGCAVIADVGGGRGHLLRAVLERAPSAQGILFDQASVVSGALAHDRMTVQAGSFFVDPLPQADCYLLSNIIHDWGDPEALTILRGIRAAAAPDSRLLLFEFVVPDDAGGFDATDIDVCMLALVSGRERTQDEYARLLAEAGFELARVIPTESQSILEARPV